MDHSWCMPRERPQSPAVRFEDFFPFNLNGGRFNHTYVVSRGLAVREQGASESSPPLFRFENVIIDSSRGSIAPGSWLLVPIAEPRSEHSWYKLMLYLGVWDQRKGTHLFADRVRPPPARGASVHQVEEQGFRVERLALCRLALCAPMCEDPELASRAPRGVLSSCFPTLTWQGRKVHCDDGQQPLVDAVAAQVRVYDAELRAEYMRIIEARDREIDMLKERMSSAMEAKNNELSALREEVKLLNVQLESANDQLKALGETHLQLRSHLRPLQELVFAGARKRVDLSAFIDSVDGIEAAKQSLKSILETWEENHMTCALSLQPINDPVIGIHGTPAGDRGVVHVYDRKSLVGAFKRKVDCCPLTRQRYVTSLGVRTVFPLKRLRDEWPGLMQALKSMDSNLKQLGQSVLDEPRKRPPPLTRRKSF